MCKMKIVQINDTFKALEFENSVMLVTKDSDISNVYDEQSCMYELGCDSIHFKNGILKNYTDILSETYFDYTYQFVKKSKAKNVLILGGGLGTLAEMFRLSKIESTTVEIDKHLCKYVKDNFNIDFINDDAIEFIKTQKDVYDAICVDATSQSFPESGILPELLSLENLQRLSKISKSIIFNVYSYQEIYVEHILKALKVSKKSQWDIKVCDTDEPQAVLAVYVNKI